MKALESYFVLTGTGAVTLIGLLFVVMTLGAERVERGDERLLGTFVTPTLVHFGVVFLIALLALSPEGGSLILPFGLIGVAGLVYTLRVSVKAARHDQVLSEAWLFHAAIPIACYVAIIAAAWLGTTSTENAFMVFRAVSALFLLAGMRNAWAVAIDIARRKAQ